MSLKKRALSVWDWYAGDMKHEYFSKTDLENPRHTFFTIMPLMFRIIWTILIVVALVSVVSQNLLEWFYIGGMLATWYVIEKGLVWIDHLADYLMGKVIDDED